jgi:hypothetical protein
MNHRVGLPRTIERCEIEPVKPMIGELQPNMLPGDEQLWRLAEGGEGAGDRTELDGLRARSYNERDTILTQLPP